MDFPKIIYLCYKTKTGTDKYLFAWKELNPDYIIKMYDDNMCKEFLLEQYGKLHMDIFNYIPDGPIKADFWRVCILYKYGGVYSDLDNIPLVSIDNFVEKEVDFVTCSSYWDKYNFNPNFIISTQGNNILKLCVEWYVKLFRNNEPYKYWDWSIMRTFTDNIKIDNYSKKDGIYNYKGQLIQILRECRGETHYDDYNIYKNRKIFLNRYPDWNHSNHQISIPTSPFQEGIGGYSDDIQVEKGPFVASYKQLVKFGCQYHHAHHECNTKKQHTKALNRSCIYSQQQPAYVHPQQYVQHLGYNPSGTSAYSPRPPSKTQRQMKRCRPIGVSTYWICS